MPATMNPRALPASFLAAQAVDPASSWPKAPPNFGQNFLPHIMTVSGRVGTKAYQWADEALRDSRVNAEKMRTDCGIMESVEARQRAVALLNWHIVPEDASSIDQKSLAEEMTSIVRRTPHLTKLRYALADSRWYGRTGVVYSTKKDWVGGKMRTVVKGWEPRHGDKLVFRYDDGSREYDPDQVGIRISGGYHIDNEWKDFYGTTHHQIEATQYGLTYWLNQWQRKLFIVNKHIIEDGPWEDPFRAGAIHGVGIRDRIYWTWYGMVECLANVMIYMERSGFGTEIWTYPANNAQAQARAEEAAKGIISGGRTVLLVPKFPGENSEDFGVERIEPGFGGVEAAMGMITDFFGHKIKRYILGQTLTSEAAATGLGSGVADAHMATFADIIKFDAAGDEEVLTVDFLRNLQLCNFPQSRGIYLRFVIDTESPDSERKMNGYRQAWEMGARIKEEDVLSTIGAALPNATDKILVNPSLQQPVNLGFSQQPGMDAGGTQPQGGDDLSYLFGPLAGETQQGDQQVAQQGNQQPPERFTMPFWLAERQPAVPALTHEAQEMPTVIHNHIHLPSGGGVPAAASQQPITMNVEIPTPEIHITPPAQAPPIVNVNVPEQAAPQVTVNVPEQPAPQVTVHAPTPVVHVAPPKVEVAAPQITVESPKVEIPAPVVNVAAPQVTVQAPEAPPQPEYDLIPERNQNGQITRVRKVPKA